MGCKINQNVFYSILVLFVLFTSCIREDISNLSDNLLINQSFSIPFGTRDLKVDAPPVLDTSSIPGIYGSFYYNNRVYPNNFPYFTSTYELDFNLRDNKAREEWIKRIVFHFLGENTFPCKVYIQVYTYGNGILLDSVFQTGPVSLDPAVTNAQGDILQSTATLFDVPFEGNRLALLKQVTNLSYLGKVINSGGKTSIIHLSNKSKVSVNIAFQVELQYNLKDATN
jgi:hypothetical protein